MKQLPKGSWITLNDLARGTTEEDILNFLRGAGIELPFDNVVVNSHRNHTQAVISLESNDVARLFHRAILDRPLNGVEPLVVYKTRR